MTTRAEAKSGRQMTILLNGPLPATSEETITLLGGHMKIMVLMKFGC